MESDRTAPVDYRAFLESTPVVPWEIDARSGRLTYVGPQAPTLLGHPLRAWLEPDFWESLVLPDDQADLFAARRRLRSRGGSHTIEYRIEHLDGHIVWVSETASAESREGRVRVVRGMLIDITERKRREAALARDRTRLRTLIHGAPDALVFTERDGTILNLNAQARLLLGYALDEVRGSSFDLMVSEQHRGRLRRHRAELDSDRARQSLVDGEAFVVERRDGDDVEVELSMTAVPMGGEACLLHALRDLSPRRRVLEVPPVARTPRRRDRVADPRRECWPAVVCDVTADQRYRSVSRRYARWCGWNPEEMIGRRVRDVLEPEVYERARAAIERVLTGRPVNFPVLVKGTDGTEHSVEVTYVPRRRGDVVTGYFIVVADIEHEVAATGSVWDLRDNSATDELA